MFICVHCPFVVMLNVREREERALLIRRGGGDGTKNSTLNPSPPPPLSQDAIKQLADDYKDRVAIVAISSNSVETHPQDGPDAIAAEVQEKGYAFPYCYDADAAVAKSFRAACTPDIYLFDAAGRLAYHGQFDDARPGAIGPRVEVTGADVRAALDDVVAGRAVQRPIKRSLGCNIKFAPGNEPDYFLSM